MMTDEKDLLDWALSTETIGEGQHDQARAKLRAHMANEQQTPVSIRARRKTAGSRSGRIIKFGAGLTTLAAGAAAVFVFTATSPSRPTDAPPTSSTIAPVVDSELITLASRVSAIVEKQTGDATLIARTQKIGDQRATLGYDLFADDGAYYYREDQAGLAEAVANNEDLSFGVYAKSVKAARNAVDGDLETARTEMANATQNAYGLGLPEAERQKIWDEANADQPGNFEDYTPAPNPPQGKELQSFVDNLVWINATDALTAGAGDAQVRAGVLRVLSTIDDVKVEKSTTEGKSTLTLKAGPGVFGGSARQDLVVDAKTGMPVASTTTVLDPGADSSTTSYQVSRITLADLSTAS